MADGDRVLWHDAMQGGYDEDLALWRGYATSATGAILELGSGTGRVAIDIAQRTDQPVWALDADRALLAACARRAGHAGVDVVCVPADACAFTLPRRFALVIAPSAFIQILGGRGERLAMLRRARRHLDDGGRICLDVIDTSDVHADGWTYRVRQGLRTYTVVCDSTRWAAPGVCEVTWRRRLSRPLAPGRELAPERVQIATLDEAMLTREAGEAGLEIVDRRDELLERRTAEPTWIYVLAPKPCSRAL